MLKLSCSIIPWLFFTSFLSTGVSFVLFQHLLQKSSKLSDRAIKLQLHPLQSWITLTSVINLKISLGAWCLPPPSLHLSSCWSLLGLNCTSCPKTVIRKELYNTSAQLVAGFSSRLSRSKLPPPWGCWLYPSAPAQPFSRSIFLCSPGKRILSAIWAISSFSSPLFVLNLLSLLILNILLLWAYSPNFGDAT